MSKDKRSAKRRRPGFWSRLTAPFRRLLAGGSRGRQGRPGPRLPGLSQKRSLAQWKELRRTTTAEVKAHLAEEQPVPAIKKLTRALLEDPQHPAYHELLRKAVELRRQRRLKPGQADPWAEFPKDLKQEALQLEAFTAYVEELEHLFDKAGLPPLSAPPPPEQRLSEKAQKRKQSASKD